MNCILFDLNTCKTLYLWCWKLVFWWVVMLEQAGGLHGIIWQFQYILRVFFFFSFLTNVIEYCWLDVMNNILFNLNTCKTLYLWCWKLVLWWITVLGLADGLHGVIRWFKYILGVFLFLTNVNEYFLTDVMNNILFDINICKHCSCDVCEWFLVGCYVRASK